MSINSTNSNQPACNKASGNAPIDRGNSDNGASDLVKIGVTVLAIGAAGVLAAFAGRKVAQIASAPPLVEEPVQDVQALQTTLARLKKVSACLTDNHKKFHKNLVKLPQDITLGYEEIIRTPLNNLPHDVGAALDKLKESDEYRSIVQSCNGIADPNKIAVGKVFLEFKMKSIEESLNL